MELTLPYGKKTLRLTLPNAAEVCWLRPAETPIIEDPAGVLAEALNAPLGCPPLESLPTPSSVAIAVPDETRPFPVATLLPVLLTRLFAAFPELSPEQVVILVAGGLHPPLDEAGLARVAPEAARQGCRVVAHDARGSAMTAYGTTSRGTPVEVNALYAAAELKIGMGLIDPHQFAGFTGGAKAVIVGAGSVPAVQANHSLMRHAEAQVGRLKDNPVRQDLNEAGRMVGVRMVVNVVLDAHKRVVKLLAGDPEAVLNEGAEYCAKVYGVEIEEPFDHVIASCGGHPKDICLYQAQKGLNMASLAARPGGRILLLAACPQGIGDEVYEEYVGRFETPEQVLQDFQNAGFRVGAHKAFLFGRTLINHEVAVASDLDEATLSRCQLKKVDPQETVYRWLAECSGRPRVGVIPNANTTYFRRKAIQTGA